MPYLPEGMQSVAHYLVASGAMTEFGG